jgi:hypothetical protein
MLLLLLLLLLLLSHVDDDDDDMVGVGVAQQHDDVLEAECMHQS